MVVVTGSGCCGDGSIDGVGAGYSGSACAGNCGINDIDGPALGDGGDVVMVLICSDLSW